MENSLMANLSGYCKRRSPVGLAYSIVQNYLKPRCLQASGRHNTSGQVAFTQGFVAAFENYLGKKVIVPEHTTVTRRYRHGLIAKP